MARLGVWGTWCGNLIMLNPRLISLLLALVTLTAYSPVIHHPFALLDDDVYVTENFIVKKGITAEGATWAFTAFYASNWHPITWLSHMLDCEVFGLDAGEHHVSSVLLHAINTVCLFALLLRLTGRLWPSTLVAALFSLHPLVIESAAWISERKNVLCASFGLLTLLVYTRYVQKRSKCQGERSGAKLHHWYPDYYLALVFFALCLMAKPMLVTLPFLMLVLDYWPLQRLSHPSFRISQLIQLVLEKWAFFLLVVPSCALALLAQHSGGMIAQLQPLPIGIRLCNVARAYVLYLWKSIWPANLTILYPFPSQHELLSAVLPASAILIIVTWLVWRARRRYPYLLAGWLWFLGTLVPAVGFVQVGAQAMNEHHAYFPLIGILIGVILGIRDLLEHFHIRAAYVAMATASLLGTCLALSEHQLSYWRDNETLFNHAIAITKDNGPAHNHLGVALAMKGRHDQAQAQFREVIRLNPLWADAHNNLGKILLKIGKPEEALVEFTKAAQLKPHEPITRENLGETLEALGRFDEALSQLKEGERLDPADPWPHFYTGRVLLHQGRDAEALIQFREALRLDPRNIQMLSFTARVLCTKENAGVRDGKTALSLALKACELSHGEAYVLDILGMAFAETGDFTNAQLAASKAIQRATVAKVQDLEPWRQRLKHYQEHQPWRESFLLTNSLLK